MLKAYNRLIAPGLIVIIHVVGLCGILYPPTRDLTLPLSALNLLVSAIILISQHQGNRQHLIMAFISCYLIGFGIEVLGVQTGFPFGIYKYGHTLGPKLWGTPLIIGVNWFMLGYLFHQLTKRLNNGILKIIVPALLMTMLDVLIEPVAIELGYWNWEDYNVPLQNYLSWFLISIVVQIILQVSISKSTNHVTIPLLLSQVIFFVFIFFL